MLLFLLALLTIIITIFIGEILGYFWHRIGTHKDIIPPVRKTHRIHHQHDIVGHEANEDFFWTFLLTIIFGGFLVLSVLLGLPLVIALTMFITLNLMFIWNWYVHAAYHIPDHFLNKFEWFKRDKKIHLEHHYDPKVNFAIASHFPDKLFGTYKEIDQDCYIDKNEI